MQESLHGRMEELHSRAVWLGDEARDVSHQLLHAVAELEKTDGEEVSNVDNESKPEEDQNMLATKTLERSPGDVPIDFDWGDRESLMRESDEVRVTCQNCRFLHRRISNVIL